jgi:hypothetical protein
MTDVSRLFAPDEGRDALRKLGGLFIGLGLFMLFIRKADSALGKPWGDWGLLIVLLVAFLFLYGIGFLARRHTDGLQAWQAVYLAFGILLAPFVLLQFVEAVNGNTGASLNIFWIFGVTAALAAAAAVAAGLRWGLLVASLAVIVSWSALWNKILSNGIGDHLGAYRGLLLLLAALLAGAAFAASSDEEHGPARGSDIATGAAVAAVIAGALSFTKLFALSNPLLAIPTADSSLFWELALLVVSLIAVAHGNRSGARGPAYVGGIGLFLFVVIAGADLNDSSPQGKVIGWPLVLLLAGAAAFVVSIAPGLKGSSSSAGAAQPPPPPPG